MEEIILIFFDYAKHLIEIAENYLTDQKVISLAHIAGNLVIEGLQNIIELIKSGLSRMPN